MTTRELTDDEWNDAGKLKADLYAVLCERNEMATEIEQLQAQLAEERIVFHETQWRLLQEARAEIARLKEIEIKYDQFSRGTFT
jgi:hypothetical protein